MAQASSEINPITNRSKFDENTACSRSDNSAIRNSKKFKTENPLVILKSALFIYPIHKQRHQKILNFL